MPTTYTQKQSPAQKKDASSATSVHDNSSQGESLQRKADLVNNNIIQRYPTTTNFINNHYGNTDRSSVQQKLRLRQQTEPKIRANSVLHSDAYNILSTYNEKPGEKKWQSIINVPCATAFQIGSTIKVYPNSHVNVWIRKDDRMGHAGPHLPNRGRELYRPKRQHISYTDLKK